MIETKTMELIAIGASVAAKCQPCLTHHLAECRKAGATEAEIKAAVMIGRVVSKGGSDAMDKFTDSLIGKDLGNQKD